MGISRTPPGRYAVGMDERKLRTLLDQLRAGSLDTDSVVAALKRLPFGDVVGPEGTQARLDYHRSIRCGCGEVVFCAGKTVEQVRQVVRNLADNQPDVLATRATPEMHQAVAEDLPEATYDATARTIVLRRSDPEPQGLVAVVAAGTSDLPVATEAKVTAEFLDANVVNLVDVGVAGLHRLLAEVETLQKARAIVVVAGMEGALASVVGGLVACPVFAVPTSVGYGASFGGLAALLAMLNSCASGVSVVNIDNGFAGGFNAAIVNRQSTAEQA